MACGCLPVVSDGGGLPDAVGVAGLTFQRGNISDLVNCIQQLNKNTKLENQLRLAAIPHLLAHRTEVIAKKYLDIIEHTLSLKKSLL
jgi:glycosyltransferase involved in cell wall biosynthesis